MKCLLLFAILLHVTTNLKAQEGWGDTDSLPKRTQFDLSLKRLNINSSPSLLLSTHLTDFTSKAIYGQDKIKQVKELGEKCSGQRIYNKDSFDINGWLVSQTYPYCDSGEIKIINNLYEFETLDSFYRLTLFVKSPNDTLKPVRIYHYNKTSGYLDSSFELHIGLNDEHIWSKKFYTYNSYNQITSTRFNLDANFFDEYNYTFDTILNDSIVVSLFDPNGTRITGMYSEKINKLLYKYIYAPNGELCYICDYNSEFILLKKGEKREYDTQCSGQPIRPKRKDYFPKNRKFKIKYYE